MTKNAPVHTAQGLFWLVMYFVALMLTVALCAEFALEFDALTANVGSVSTLLPSASAPTGSRVNIRHTAKNMLSILFFIIFLDKTTVLSGIQRKRQQVITYCRSLYIWG